MNLPEKFLNHMKNMLGDEFNDFCSAFCEGTPTEGIRLNPEKAKYLVPEGLDFLRGALPVAWCKDGYYADKSVISGKHPYHEAGLFYFQEPSAMAVAEALDVTPGEIVLDLCAAPGGKATAVGAKLRGEGMLIANEIVEKRARILAENVERFGLSNTAVLSEEPEKLAKRFPEFFDKIVVDAPCSGEGMFRKEPLAAPNWSEEHTESCAVRQKNILDSALKMLKPGGKLVYSTCTFAPVENEGVCEYVLENYPDIRLENITLPGLSDAKGEYVGSERDFSYAKRIFPHKARGEGHFLALFKKEGESEKVVNAAPVRDKKVNEALKLYKDFEKKSLTTELEGNFRLFGENLYLALPLDFDGLRVIRPGLHLGVCKKDRFEPSHALALALSPDDFKEKVGFSAESREIEAYMHGDVIPGESKGWCAVLADGLVLGWAKGTGSILKNHLPKGLRNT